MRLYYQQTSWEYVQFLWKNNDGLNAFLGAEGRNLLDAWLNTGMATPLELTAASTSVSAPTVTPGEASDPTNVSGQMLASYNKILGAIDVAYAVLRDRSQRRRRRGFLRSQRRGGLRSHAGVGVEMRSLR